MKSLGEQKEPQQLSQSVIPETGGKRAMQGSPKHIIYLDPPMKLRQLNEWLPLWIYRLKTKELDFTPLGHVFGSVGLCLTMSLLFVELDVLPFLVIFLTSFLNFRA